MYHGPDDIKKINPRETTNCFSLITFLFTFNLLKKGYKKDITEDDIYQVPRKFKSDNLGNKLEKEWEKEQENPKPSLYRLLWRSYGRFYLLLGLVQLTMKILMVMIQPRALGKLVSYFAANSALTKFDAIYYAAVLVGLNIINTTYNHNYMFWITELGIKIRAAVCSLIYKKSLKLTSSSLAEVGIGRILTIITKDVGSIEIAIIFINDMWIGFILLGIVSCLMYSRVGIAALSGILFLVMIIPLQIILGKLTSMLRIKGSKITDHRLRLTQETLSAIKIIKMYTWETFFGEKISKARRQEMTKIRAIYWTKATSLVIGGLVTSLTLYIIVITYTSLGNNFTAEVSFFIWGCLNMLRQTITISLPIGIVQTAELVASLKRIRRVLVADEQTISNREKTSTKPSITLEEVTVKIKDKLILDDVSIKIEPGLNCLVGRLGGGKSSLLKTILEDYQITEGKLKINGRISYASEDPWLFPSSIKQNILFGQKYNEERYKKILNICALELDINTLAKGDETLVDDRGMNLSKGQQARISLARAVYCDSDIYLLDDCLASLDTRVQKFVFTECIRNFLKDKIVLMISHNDQLVKEADNVIYLENGRIKSCLNPCEIAERDIEEMVKEEDETYDIIDNIVLEDEDVNEETALIAKPVKNIYSEKKKEGTVDIDVYKRYFSYGGGFLLLLVFAVLFISGEIANTYSQKLVSNWANIQQNISEYKFKMTNSTKYDKLIKLNTRTLNLYTIAVITATALLLSRAYTHFFITGKASYGLHTSMILSIIKATMKFFDSHYIGNILNRFSKDLSMLDELLPLNLYEFFNLICRLSGILILILIVNWWFIVPAVIVTIILFLVRRWYLPTGRSLKRLDAATRSPMVGHINASLEGLTTIRAYGTQDILKDEFDRHQDFFISANYMMQCAQRAFGYYLDMLGNLFIASIVIILLFSGKEFLPGNVGLAVSQALLLTGFIQWGIRQWAELENQMTSVERVLEYTDIEKENDSGTVKKQWPTKGQITFENVNLTYGTSKKYVLKNINFTVKSKEKVAIVGRTGAGKTSLIGALFRLYQFEGSVKIDNVDTKTLQLTFLRSNITIIPQDPILFAGNIRKNIDPLGRYKDENIWQAVEMAHLKDLVKSLDQEIDEGGCNFSAGQKQLICLARAIVSKSKIIVLDEATANIDPETDVLIYNTINESFADCTVLTIVHRLHTVLYSDRVMVVDKGEVIEFDTPNVLLDNKGVFYRMIKQANLLT